MNNVCLGEFALDWSKVDFGPFVSIYTKGGELSFAAGAKTNKLREGSGRLGKNYLCSVANAADVGFEPKAAETTGSSAKAVMTHLHMGLILRAPCSSAFSTQGRRSQMAKANHYAIALLLDTPFFLHWNRTVMVLGGSI